MENLNINVCCNNMVQAVRAGAVLINELEFCLANTEHKLKEPTEKYDTAIIKIFFCPWCGKNLGIITADIKQKIKEREHALGK